MTIQNNPPGSELPAAPLDSAEERERLRVLESFEIDALQDDPELDAIVRFAAKLCDVPVAQVSLVEDVRQRFLAGEGLDVTETPRDVSFCQHAMRNSDLMEVRDATQDPRFAENLLVTAPPEIRFYAGQPLISDEGAPLGALCAIDVKARPEGLTDFQRQGMAVLGQAVMRRLNARRAGLQAQRAIAEREARLLRMIEGVPQIAWSADAAGNFDYFNTRWEQVTGAPPPKTADDWRPFIHPDDARQAFADWERAFSKGEDFETEYRLRHADGSWNWVLALAVPVAERAGDPLRWFGTITDIHEVHQALEERDMLAKELSHRIKNIFAVVIGLATLKARKAPEHLPFAEDLTDILRALGRAHEFVRPTGGPSQESLLGLLTALFAPYRDENGKPRVRLTGADAAISPRSATPIALVFHELATNSAKYGALSNEDGHVDLRIEDREDTLALDWSEHGGPAIEPSGDTGFGSRLVEMSVKGQLQGTWDRQFREDGLAIALTVSKKAIAA